MKSFAKISVDSLKTYKESVKSIDDYSPTAANAVSDFDVLIDFLNSEIEKLEEKVDQLNIAESEIENKIAEYENKIEEKESFIEEKEADLDNIRSELAVTDEYITYYNSEGYPHEGKNGRYSSLVRQEAAVENKLSAARSELEVLVKCLNRCHALKNEVASVLSIIEKRLSVLNVNKNTAEKNKNEFSNTVTSLTNHSAQAFSKLTMIEKCLNDYVGVQVSVVSAFESVYRDIGNRKLSDLEYMTPKFKNAPSRDSSKSYYDDEGKMYKNPDGLVPNSTFKLNKYTFTTDSSGRPATASGKLSLSTEKKDRIWDSTLNEMGQGDERTDDDRGHMIGHRFDGPDSILNAFPQEQNINRGEYKAFENFLASELEAGKEIFISISTIYSGDSRRPIGVAFSYTINGVRRMRFFDNEIKGGVEE